MSIQKVHLRAVWMGRNLGVEKEVIFRVQNQGRKMTQKRDRFLPSKSALISIFFSYKEISVRKIALKPLVPVRLRAVLVILRIFAHF